MNIGFFDTNEIRTKCRLGKRTHRFGALLFSAIVGVLGTALLTAAAASAAEGCDGLLPDLLGNCTREARPAGHVAPMSMPYLFEDPYITTGLNFVGIYHNFPTTRSLMVATRA